MKFDRDISKYSVFRDDSIVSALKKIDSNKAGIVFLVSEAGIIEASITDGDFRRWLVKQSVVDLNQAAIVAANQDFLSMPIAAPPGKIEDTFSSRIKFIPLTDAQGHFVAVAKSHSDGVPIGNFLITEESPAFVISEIGINHNGDIELAKRMVDLSIEAGADCAKFQMRDMKSLYGNAGNANDPKEDLGAQYTLDILSRSQLTNEQMAEVFDYCREKGILPLCTPWDLKSVEVLEKCGMPAYKVASADLTNTPLLEALIATGKSLILSTGMSREEEILEAVALLKSRGANYVLLHCNSTYPAPFKDVNLNYLERLREIGDCPVGYSGHERGYNVVIGAVAQGARVIEKHFTVDRNMEGNDHKVSLLPHEFKAMVEGIRQLEQAMGSPGRRELTQGEKMNRETLAKSLVVTRAIKKNDVITAEMIDSKSPGKGLQPNRRRELIGLRAPRDMEAGDFFFPSDLLPQGASARPYDCKRPWGPPVRFHDFKTLWAKSNPDFLEFHFSYKDLEVKLSDHLTEKYDVDLVVHSPDLFPGDHLLNLAAEDDDYRAHSIRELQRVIDFTRSMKPFFRNADEPTKLIVSLGGFTKDGHVSSERQDEMYARVLDSVRKLDTEGVRILPQTLPPFPWYFGGQLYLNIFLDHVKTAKFCRDSGLEICFDVCHSKLSANFLKVPFSEFAEVLAPHTAHLHLVDAIGVDGEGIQIGEGEIDFAALARTLDAHAPNASFIPEIWQGHKNEGEAFWVAMDRLEKWF